VHAPSGEQQRRRGLDIDPLQVVDDHQEGGGLGRGGQQRQRAGSDQVPVSGPARGTPAEGGRESLRLPRGNVLQVAADGGQELEQAGVCKWGLGLQAPGQERDEPFGARSGCPEQCGLAEARVAHDQKASGRTRAGRLQQPVDPLEFGSATDQAFAPAVQIEGFPRRDGTPAGLTLARQNPRGRKP
jgi:hypothetical protein